MKEVSCRIASKKPLSTETNKKNCLVQEKHENGTLDQWKEEVWWCAGASLVTLLSISSEVRETTTFCSDTPPHLVCFWWGPSSCLVFTHLQTDVRSTWPRSRVMEWCARWSGPPQSPHLNSAGMVWDELDRRVKQKQPRNAQHMCELLWECWRRVPGDSWSSLRGCQERAKLSSKQKAATLRNLKIWNTF